MDEIAERLLTLGGKPVATLKEHLEHVGCNRSDWQRIN